MPLPLPFFTHKSLRYIIDNLALIPIRKIEANGIHKKGSIIDINKLSQTLRKELSLTFGQYSKATSQMYSFQALRDIDSPDEEQTWTCLWEQHFLFFKNQHDAEEYYKEWKHTEFDLCKECWSYNFNYDGDHYVHCYLTAKNNMIQRQRFKDEMNRRESKWRAQSDWKP